MQQPDIHRLIELQKLLLEFQKVDRFLFIPGRGERHENDIEHSYNLAMCAWFLSQYFPELNRDEVIRYALVHDMVEIHAGDTMIFHNPEGMASKQQREEAALEKLGEDWKDFPEMTAQLHGYEQKDTPEARFVYALDKVMPAMMNLLQGGTVWRKHKVTFDDFRDAKEAKIKLAPEVWPYYEQLRDILAKQQELFYQPGKTSEAAEAEQA
jgi:putative hydrolase of HD superfamily